MRAQLSVPASLSTSKSDGKNTDFIFPLVTLHSLLLRVDNARLLSI
jgi:hypothetical protein